MPDLQEELAATQSEEMLERVLVGGLEEHVLVDGQEEGVRVEHDQLSLVGEDAW